MPLEIRPTRDEDRLPLAQLYADVAEERIYIGGEPPVDVEARAASWSLAGDFVALDDGRIIGGIHIGATPFGVGVIGMMVARDWRGRGVGSALMQTAIDWAREQGLHKLCLDVWPHNESAIALYKKFGFVQEGFRVKQRRRANGELWDELEMGLLL